MIKNDRQLKIARDILRDFEKTKENLISQKDKDPFLFGIGLNSVNEDIRVFERDIRDYLELKSGKINSINIEDFNRFSELLIKTRIARGWTQAELAEKINVKEQQIQRYEATDYETASLARIDEIVYAMGIATRIRINAVGLTRTKFRLPEGFTEDSVSFAQSRASNRRELVSLQH